MQSIGNIKFHSD